MSLSVLNEHRDDDPEGDSHGYLWVPARVATAAQTGHGHDALGVFYNALWTNPDGTEREWIGDIGEALLRSELPAGLTMAGTTTDHDAELRYSTTTASTASMPKPAHPSWPSSRPRATSVHSSDQFSPTLLPARTPSLLWEAVLRLLSVRAFQELKG
jgi:hypothetical protein